MASDSASLVNLLQFFPELGKELGVTFKDIVGRTKPSFQHAKERVIIAESFLHKMPNLPADSKKNLVTLIKDVGNSKELKTHLKAWEPSPTGGLPAIFSMVKSIFVSKEQTSNIVNEAAAQSKNTKDQEFFAALQDKVYREPLLEQLAQDVMAEASRHFQDSLKQYLPRLYLRAHDIRQRTVYHQVEVEGHDQDQKRRASIRSEWFDEIKMVQAQVDPGYAFLFYPNGRSDIVQYMF